ncbi:MAG: hypothetical protein OHK0022_54080 [Roseiflexaceae bacterium]
MNRHFRRHLLLLLLLFGTSTPLINSPQPHTVLAQPANSCATQPEAPGSTDLADNPIGELSLEKKHIAFDGVLGNVVRYGDYQFPVAVTQIQRTSFYPVLLKSMAGIESSWTQYRNGTTLVNTESCDFGLMQINENARAGLFALNPSLRSDTRGNIAAAAQTLSELWAQGLFGNLPLVNDGDPTWLPNWYYVLSAYNSGPGSGIWLNNPACGLFLTCEAGSVFYNYSFSRPDQVPADWTQLEPKLYPYQERVLYNLTFPIQLSQHQIKGIHEWLVAGLNFKAITEANDTGLRPEDSVFVRTNSQTGLPVSYAPNLLLFSHRASTLTPGQTGYWILFEYDLPFSAQVTITLVLSDDSEQLVCTRAGVAGWNQHYCRVNVPLQQGDAYRIRAERGRPDDWADYYLGQYLQAFSFAEQPLQTQNLPHRVHLPLVANSGLPVALLNPKFLYTDPLQSWKPDRWDVQALFSRHPISGLPNITDKVSRADGPQGWRLKAAPGGVVELRQRISLEPGNYLLRVQFDVTARDASSVLSIRTRPALPGPQPWSLVDSIAADQNGQRYEEYRLRLDAPTTISLVAAFGSNDNASAFTVRSVELFRSS